MYQISDIVEVNEARKELFTQKSRSLENLAPTSTALEEHIKEELNDNLYMDYTLPEAASSCSELMGWL